MINKRMLPNKGSTNDKLLQLGVGARMYVETTLDGYGKDMRLIHTCKSRRPLALKDCEFTTSLFTGVSSGSVGDIRYLICIERTK